MTDSTVDVDDVQDAAPASVEAELQVDAVDVEPETPEDTGPDWTSDDEEKARKFNWKSENEWRGDKPPGYIADPRQYVEKIERHPIYQTLQGDLQQQKAAQEELLRKMQAVSDRLRDADKAKYDADLARLTADQRKAAEEGDMQAFDAAADKMRSLEPPRDEAPQQAPQVDPYVQAYAETDRGAWLANPVLQKHATDLVAGNPSMLMRPAKDQVEYAEAEMRKMFPAYFSDAAPTPKPRQARVDGGGIGGGGAKLSAFDKLPDEAKSQFQAEVKRGTFEDSKDDRAEYANFYNNG